MNLILPECFRENCFPSTFCRTETIVELSKWLRIFHLLKHAIPCSCEISFYLTPFHTNEFITSRTTRCFLSKKNLTLVLTSFKIQFQSKFLLETAKRSIFDPSTLFTTNEGWELDAKRMEESANILVHATRLT